MLESQIPPEIQARTTGQFPISIGTSLALEGIFGIHEQITYPIDDKQPYKRFSNIVINLRTLVRNIYQSVKTSEAQLFTVPVMVRLLLDEMNIIREIVQDRSHKRLKVYFYAGLYRKLNQKFPGAKTVDERTDKQREYHQFETDVFNLLLQMIEDGSVEPYIQIPDRWFDFNISPTVPKISHLGTLIRSTVYLTHLPLDLLLVPSARLSLLESHTGKIKDSYEFNSKLKGKPENMPFDIMTIQMYGDSAGLFVPQELKFRKELTKIGKLKGWNATTTPMKVKLDVKLTADPGLYHKIQSLYKVR